MPGTVRQPWKRGISDTAVGGAHGATVCADWAAAGGPVAHKRQKRSTWGHYGRLSRQKQAQRRLESPDVKAGLRLTRWCGAALTLRRPIRRNLRRSVEPTRLKAIKLKQNYTTVVSVERSCAESSRVEREGPGQRRHSLGMRRLAVEHFGTAAVVRLRASTDPQAAIKIT